RGRRRLPVARLCNLPDILGQLAPRWILAALDISDRIYARLQAKLGVSAIRSDSDVLALVERRLPVRALGSLGRQGLREAERPSLVLRRGPLAPRRAGRQPLTREESDRAVRVARVIALAEDVFDDRDKALRWLRKPKRRFNGRTPMDVLLTD